MMPQNPQMAAYTFAPQQSQQQQQQQPREAQKNYVFVDEHNRHKRLKVMRACEGCRRRKIKCDAATTNTWPCSACVRLKLHCVRPNGFDSSDTTTYETTTAPSAPATSTHDFSDQALMQATFSQNAQQSMQSTIGVPDPRLFQQQQQQQQQQFDASQMYQVPFPDQQLQYSPMAAQPSAQMINQQFTSTQRMATTTAAPAQNMYPVTPPTMTLPPPQPPTVMSVSTVDSTHMSQPQDMGSPDNGSQGYSNPDLSDLLGALKMSDTGTAPYLRNKASFRREQPPPEEDEDDQVLASLPPIRAGKIRIPPELMPSDETALHYFELYFTHIHPYLPVLSKPLFYQQWTYDRNAISPLILEVLFAFGSRLADEATQGQQWLALATKHVDIFMDVPRMSTLQAVMILMKARESVPQKGYYYRSWMNIVSAIQMARELGLDEHSEEHNDGKECYLPHDECRLKTRVWQVVYVLETMIGTSQGRTSLSIDCEEINFDIFPQSPGEDIPEYIISRNFTYLARLVREVGLMNITYAKMKKKVKNNTWASDPEFLKFGPALDRWRASLVEDLSVTFPPDNSPPWIHSAFCGNILTYHYLSVILLHRPQLALCDPNTMHDQYRRIMLVCTESAKAICKLHEAVMAQYEFTGLQGMLRGYSYVVYCGLTCIVIHLVAMTSPDPEISADAGEFFTRHMRLLEEVMSIWSIPDVKRQIDAVRKAFSADIRKPFALKPSFPYGSPASSHSSPPQSPPDHLFKQSPNMMPTTMNSGMAQNNFGQLTTPVSTTMQNNMMMPRGQSVSMASTMPLQAPVWNPAPIFEQWNTTFGPPPTMRPSAGSASPSQQTVSNSPSAMDMASLGITASAPIAASQQMQAQTFQNQNLMTPEMWQQSVASVYEGGLKRAWDYDNGPRKR